MAPHDPSILDVRSSCIFNYHGDTSFSDSHCCITLLSSLERNLQDYFPIAFSILLFSFLTTSFAYFKVFRIIRRHQQQVQAPAPCQRRPAINLAKYKKIGVIHTFHCSIILPQLPAMSGVFQWALSLSSKSFRCRISF